MITLMFFVFFLFVLYIRLLLMIIFGLVSVLLLNLIYSIYLLDFVARETTPIELHLPFNSEQKWFGCNNNFIFDIFFLSNFIHIVIYFTLWLLFFHQLTQSFDLDLNFLYLQNQISKNQLF